MVSEVDSKDKESPDLASMVLQQATSSMVLKETSMVLQKATTQATAHPVLPHGEAEAMVAKAEAGPEVCSAPLMVRDHSTSPFLRLRECLSWWRLHATKEVCSLIQEGVEPLFPALSLNILPRGAPTLEQQQAALTVVQEYVPVGTATMVDIAEMKDSTKTNFGTLVHYRKGFSIRSKKVQAHFRLQSFKFCIQPPKISSRKLERYPPPSKERGLGGKVGHQECILPPGKQPQVKTLPQIANRRKTVSDGGGGFWPEHNAILLAKTNEHIPEKMEARGSDSFYLFGRHFTSGPLPRKCKKGIKGGLDRFGPLMTPIEHGIVSYRASAGTGPFRLSFKLKRGFVAGASTKNEDNKERTRKTVNTLSNKPKESVLHSRGGKGFFIGNPKPKGFFRQPGKFHKQPQYHRLGHPLTTPPISEGTSKRAKHPVPRLERKEIRGKINLRQFHSDSSQWAWGGGHCTGGPCTRMVEGRIIPPHKSKGIKGCSRYSPGPGKARRHSALVSRQHCCIQLPKETRGEKTSFQQHTETPVGTLHKKGYNFVTKFSGLQRLPGRQYFQMASGQGRLSIKPPHLFRNNKNIPGVPGPQSGHVCLPWKQTVTPVGGEVSPPWSSRLQRLRNASGPSRDARGGICQPPLVHNKPMATEAKGKPLLRVPSSSAPMGWMYMVAPTNQAAKQAMPSFGYSPQVGPFHQLPGREDATYKVAPPLSGFIRQMLQAKQVSAENITLYLTGIKSLDRYDEAFRTLWASIVARGGPSNPVLTGHC